MPIAGAQLCYYNAVAHLSVGVALLLEYTAPILVVGWLWATTRRRPTNLTLAGVVLAVAGIMLVLDVFSLARTSTLVGVGMGTRRRRLCGVLLHDVRRSERRRRRRKPELHHARRRRTDRRRASAIAMLGVVRRDAADIHHQRHRYRGMDDVLGGARRSARRDPTAIAYTLGIMGIARLRPRFASLVGLSEVMFAVLAAWLLLGEAITTTQAIGGAVVLVGLALARQGDRSENLVAATWPDTGAVEQLTPCSRANG